MSLGFANICPFGNGSAPCIYFLDQSVKYFTNTYLVGVKFLCGVSAVGMMIYKYASNTL